MKGRTDRGIINWLIDKLENESDENEVTYTLQYDITINGKSYHYMRIMKLERN